MENSDNEIKYDLQLHHDLNHSTIIQCTFVTNSCHVSLGFFSASIFFTNSHHYNDKNLESQASISVTQYDWIFFPTRKYMFKAANKTLTHFTPPVFFYTP